MKKWSLLFFILGTVFLNAYNVSDIHTHARRIEQHKKNGIQLDIMMESDIGIQNKAVHSIKLYRISRGHKVIQDIAKKIQSFGVLEKVRTSMKGEVSLQDANYLSQVKSIIFYPISVSSDYVVESKIYYCNLKQGLCKLIKLYNLIQ